MAAVNARRRGRPAPSSAAAATHWRTATTPTGPSAGKASAARAAPIWLDRPLPHISATPAQRFRAGAATAGEAVFVIAIPALSIGRTDTQNASRSRSIRWTHGRSARLELRHLRCLVAIVDTGSFTDAAIELGVSQAAVSRGPGSAGADPRRTAAAPHEPERCTPTTAGVQVLGPRPPCWPRPKTWYGGHDRAHPAAHRARVVGDGRHTAEFQRRWAHRYPDVELLLVRTNTATGGLGRGAVRPRRGADRRGPAHVRARDSSATSAVTAPGGRRPLGAPPLGHRWPRSRHPHPGDRPADRHHHRRSLARRSTSRVEHTKDIDDWLAAIATGRCVGVTRTPP